VVWQLPPFILNITVKSTYNEPTVMWRMRHPDGRSAHTVIAPKGPETLAVVFVNDDLKGVRDFKTWDSAIRWTEQMSIQLEVMGWQFADSISRNPKLFDHGTAHHSRRAANRSDIKYLMRKREESVNPTGPGQSAAAGGPTPAAQVVMHLGKSVFIRGEVSTSEDLTLYGQMEMEGSIRLPHHALTIGLHANVKAGISARAVVIMGTVSGDVSASERVEIQASGSVDGDITTPRLMIAEGGQLRGRVEMSSRTGKV
jgi:cytoskeletal protein CcmA (bactofilin family)